MSSLLWMKHCSEVGKTSVPRLSCGEAWRSAHCFEIHGGQSSGLVEAWVEGNLLGPKTAEKVRLGSLMHME